MTSLSKKEKTPDNPPKLTLPRQRLTPREAILSDAEVIGAEDSLGRVLADITVGCPPAVPIVVSGEEIDGDAIKAFKYYGIEKIKVVK